MQELDVGTHRKSDIEEKREEDEGDTSTIESNNSTVLEESNKKSNHDESLFKALHRTFFTQIWIAGVLKLVASECTHLCALSSCLLAIPGTLRTTTPLLNKVILTWLEKSYVYARLPESRRQEMEAPQGIGYGIGLAVALFVMQGMWFIAEHISRSDIC